MRIDPYAQRPVNNCSWLSGWLQGCWVFSCLHSFPSSPAGDFLSYWDYWLKMLLKLTQCWSLLELSGGFMGMVSFLSISPLAFRAPLSLVTTAFQGFFSLPWDVCTPVAAQPAHPLADRPCLTYLWWRSLFFHLLRLHSIILTLARASPRAPCPPSESIPS